MALGRARRITHCRCGAGGGHRDALEDGEGQACEAAEGGDERKERRSERAGRRAAAAPREDHDYLLRACGGDEEELARRLEAELRRNPHQSEAELYRRAIRRILRPER